MTLTYIAALSNEQLAAGRAFLRTLDVETLDAMLAVLLPGVRTGDAGLATWAAINAIRDEVGRRPSEEATS